MSEEVRKLFPKDMKYMDALPIANYIEDLQQRIDKAIEYINETWWYENEYQEDIIYLKDEFGIDKLLEILQKYKGDNK